MIENKLKYDFFICSSENDSTIVEQTLEQLSGFSVFYPPRDIAQQSGKMFFDVLTDALAESKNLILIICPEATKSKWTKIEYQTFFTNFYSAENHRKIILLKGKEFNVNDVPLFFRNFQIFDDVEQIISKANPEIKSFLIEKASPELEEKMHIDRKRKKMLTTFVYLLTLAIIATAAFTFFDRYGEHVLAYLKVSYESIMFSEPKAEELQPISKSPEEDLQVIENDLSVDRQQDVTLRFDEQRIEDRTTPGIPEGLDHPNPERFLKDSPFDQDIVISDRQVDLNLREYIKELPDAKVLNFPNGNRYEGNLIGGTMHGQGVFHYAVRSLISKNDPLERYAEAGSYLVGEWFNGELYMGRLYDRRGEMKERIIVGRK